MRVLYYVYSLVYCNLCVVQVCIVFCMYYQCIVTYVHYSVYKLMFSRVLFYVLKVSYILLGITVCVFQCVSCYMYDCVCKLSIGAMLYSLLLLLLLLLMSSYLQDCFAIFHDDFCILVFFSSFSVSFCNLDVCIYLFFYVLLTTEVLIIYITEIVCSTMQRNKKNVASLFSVYSFTCFYLFFLFSLFYILTNKCNIYPHTKHHQRYQHSYRIYTY